MGKNRQSSRLGNLADFSGRPEFPSEMDLEQRVTNLERAVNEILHQLADLSAQLDQPIRNQDFGDTTQRLKAWASVS